MYRILFGTDGEYGTEYASHINEQVVAGLWGHEVKEIKRISNTVYQLWPKVA